MSKKTQEPQASKSSQALLRARLAAQTHLVSCQSRSTTLLFLAFGLGTACLLVILILLLQSRTATAILALLCWAGFALGTGASFTLFKNIDNLKAQVQTLSSLDKELGQSVPHSEPLFTPIAPEIPAPLLLFTPAITALLWLIGFGVVLG